MNFFFAIFQIPGVVKRVYNLQSKQLVKIFSRIFEANESKMLNDLDQSGDVAATISEFFENSSNVEPAKKCMLYNYIITYTTLQK